MFCRRVFFLTKSPSFFQIDDILHRGRFHVWPDIRGGVNCGSLLLEDIESQHFLPKSKRRVEVSAKKNKEFIGEKLLLLFLRRGGFQARADDECIRGIRVYVYTFIRVYVYTCIRSS
jgi:hypothetical protein